MNQHPLLPFINLFPDDSRQGYRPETEREIFERIAATMREDRRRERRQHAFGLVRGAFGRGRTVASGGSRVARNH
jgi:hypothetical protein